MEEKKTSELMAQNAESLQHQRGLVWKDTLLKAVLRYCIRPIKLIAKGKFKYVPCALTLPLSEGFHKGDEPKEIMTRDVSKDRIAVYTVMFGNYDSIADPLYITDNCDYYIITDQDVPKDSAWKKYPINSVAIPDSVNTNKLKSRFFKIMPHVLFPDYKYSVYVDSNITIVADVRPVVSMLGNCFIAIHGQPGRDCAYQEAKIAYVLELADPDMIEKQMDAYRREGFPEHYGLFRNCVLVREHNQKQCIQLMNDWMNEMIKYTQRDQLSFTYSLWKNGLSKNDVGFLGSDVRKNPRFILRLHK